MISNATRTLCAMPGTISAAGLLVFANPANAIGAVAPSVVALIVTIAATGTTDRA